MVEPSFRLPPVRRPATSVALALALALICIAPLPAAGASADRGLAMADTFLNMMQAMGLFRSDDSWQRMADAWRSGGGSGALDDSSRYEPDPAMRGGRLNGLWRGRGGEWLLIRGPYFRLLSGRGQQVDGMLRLHDNLLSLFTGRGQKPWVYEFAEDQGRLVLRDRQGNLFLYRRQPPQDTPRR